MEDSEFTDVIRKIEKDLKFWLSEQTSAHDLRGPDEWMCILNVLSSSFVGLIITLELDLDGMIEHVRKTYGTYKSIIDELRAQVRDAKDGKGCEESRED